MPDPTRWTRLEPAARDRSLASGLAARVHDPLWLLARQRQLGELTADAELGAAVTVELTAEAAPLTRLGAAPYAAGAAAPDARVEAEPVRTAPTARLRAAAGLHFLRLLAQAGLDRYAEGYRAAYALAPAAVP